MCSCHSIPECCVMFSGVKLSIWDRLFYYRNYDAVCRQNLDGVTLEQVMVQTLDVTGKSGNNSKI